MSKKNLTKNLEELSKIARWFEDSQEIDIEEGINKVREAVKIIKDSRERLKEIENEFEEIKKELDD